MSVSSFSRPSARLSNSARSGRETSLRRVGLVVAVLALSPAGFVLPDFTALDFTVPAADRDADRLARGAGVLVRIRFNSV